MMPADLHYAVGMIFFIESETDDVELPGERLKAAREARGETVEAAAARCLLSVTVIQGLESNDYSALSGLSFVRGYLQIYARKLGLSEADVLEPFDTWRGTTPTVSQPVHQFSELDLHRTKRPTWIVPVLVGVFSLSVLGGVLFWAAPRVGPWLETVDLERMLRALPFQSSPSDVVAPEPLPSVAMPLTPSSSTPQVALPEASEPPAKATARASEQRVSTNTASDSDPDPAPAEPVGAPSTTAVTALPEQPPQPTAERALPTMQASTPSLGNGFLQLRFTEQSWVEIRNREGDLIMADLMRPGVDFDLEVTEVVEVLIGAVHATELRFNGERLDLSGRAYQNVARITLGEPAP